MASILLTGVLLDPNGDPAHNDQVRFTHKTTTGNTINGSVSVEKMPVDGSYSIELEYGNILVEYKDAKKPTFNVIGIVTVNQDSTATSLPELLNAIVPPTDEQLLEFQAILADCVAAADRSEVARDESEAARDESVAAKGEAVSAASERVFTRDTVDAMKADTTLSAGDYIQTVDYYSTQRGGGASYLIKTVAQAAADGDTELGYGNHAIDGGLYVAIIQDVSNAAQYGTGTSDDSPHLQSYVNSSFDVVLSDSHNLSEPININKDVFIRSKNLKTLLNTSFGGAIFKSTTMNVSINNLEVSGDVVIIEQSSDFNEIKVENSIHDGLIDSLSPAVMAFSQFTSGNLISMTGCDLKNCSGVFADDVAFSNAIIANNKGVNISRWLFRSVSNEKTHIPKNARIESNDLSDINGGITDKTAVARFVMFEGTGTLKFFYNIVDGAESTVATEMVYLGGGSLDCRGNQFKRLLGDANTSNIIKDKANQELTQSFSVSDNVFDMTDVAAGKMSACVFFNSQRKIQINNNKFIGSSCAPIRIYQAADVGTPAGDISIHSNQYFDLDYPLAISIFQSISSVSVSNEVIHKISNSNSTSVNGRSNCRAVDIYQTFNNSINEDKIRVNGVVINETPVDSFVVHANVNAVAQPTGIDDVSVVNCEMKGTQSGCAIMRYTGSGYFNRHVIANNIMPPGSSEIIGTAPPDLRLLNNLIT